MGGTAHCPGERRGSCEVRGEFVREKTGTSPWREGDVTDVGLRSRDPGVVCIYPSYTGVNADEGGRGSWRCDGTATDLPSPWKRSCPSHGTCAALPYPSHVTPHSVRTR